MITKLALKIDPGTPKRFVFLPQYNDMCSRLLNDLNQTKSAKNKKGSEGEPRMRFLHIFNSFLVCSVVNLDNVVISRRRGFNGGKKEI
jgi:hypothetical protein